MVCTRCDSQNPSTNIYCDVCGSALLDSFSQPESQLGYQQQMVLETPPQSYHGTPSELLIAQKIYERKPGITPFRVFRVFIYFIGVFIAGFGLVAEFISISNNQTMVGLGIFFWLGLIVAAVVIFVRLRQRIHHLGAWQLIGWLAGATVGALMAFILEFSLMPDINKSHVSSFVFSCIILLYGLILAGAAWW